MDRRPAIRLGRRSFVQGLWASAVAAASGEAFADPPSVLTPILYLQPLGKGLAADHVDTVKRALLAFYPLHVLELASVALPSEAYYAPRNRYRAERILNFLEATAAHDAYRVLGLTALDISTTKGSIPDWGILGLAAIDGRACVLSAFRCSRGVDRARARARLGKVAVHEIGHTLGLEHCSTVGCLMEDARGTVTTTDREYDLCARCHDLLAQSGRRVRPTAKPPWPKPAQT